MGTHIQVSEKMSFLPVLVVLFLIPSTIRAQNEDRCSIVQGPGCIDFDPNTNSILTVPATTTRIERDAIDVCVQGITGTKPVDVVFVVDQSGSMEDNDPDNQAPAAVNFGLELLNSLAPGSYATVLRFATGISLPGVENCAEPTPDMTPVNTGLEGLKDWVTTNIPTPGAQCDGQYTNYHLALPAADSLVRKGPHADSNKVIIFITDGEPHDPTISPPYTATYDNWTGKDRLVPVHSIFIGGRDAAEDCSNPRSAGGRLGCLASITGGSYNPIEDVSELQGIIEQIVNQVIQSASVTQTAITNSTNGASNIVPGANHSGTEPQFTANMANVIALNEGPNTVVVTTTATIGGVPTNLSETVTINVQGTTTDLADVFDLACDDGSQIVATDVGFNNTITTMNYDAAGFGVQLTSSDEVITTASDNLTTANTGDNESYGMTLSNGAGQHLVIHSVGASQPNGNIETAEGGDQILISWMHPQDPRDTASYVLTVTDERETVEIVNTWITDQDGDGAGDMIFIQTSDIAPELPTTITHIDWPGNGTNVKTTTSNQISYLDSDSTIIVVDLTNNPFDVGVTAPAGNPTLTMPDQGPYYTGSTHPIEDRIGAVLTEVTKNPSNFTQIGHVTLVNGVLDTVYTTNPDTLAIRTSEPIIGTGGDIITYVDGDDTLQINIIGDPIRDPNDSLVWRIIIPASRDINSLRTGDVVILNPNSNYTDTRGNTNGTGGRETGGRDGAGGEGIVTQIVTPVITTPDEHSRVTNPNVQVDTRVPIVELDGDTTYTDVTPINRWIPPHGVIGTVVDPKVLLDIQQECLANGTTRPHTCTGDDCPDIKESEGCLSRIAVVAQVDEGPYRATINIFDHLGKFVRSLEQWWGYCGEASNVAASVPGGGVVSYLAWDLKDEEGVYVGSGVYVIKVIYHFPQTDRVHNVLYKQGVARFSATQCE